MDKQINGFATLEIKSFGDEKTGLIRGRLSHIAADRDGDIIEPRGLKFKLPLPLRHEHSRNVGTIHSAEVSDTDIMIEAQLADPEEAQSESIRERLLAAWDAVKLGLAKGLSVGIIPLEWEELTERSWGPRRFTKAELIEGSIVEIPANARATIATVKSYAGYTPSGSRITRVDPELVRRVTRDDGAYHL